jgi:hypothetical protein
MSIESSVISDIREKEGLEHAFIAAKWLTVEIDKLLAIYRPTEVSRLSSSTLDRAYYILLNMPYRYYGQRGIEITLGKHRLSTTTKQCVEYADPDALGMVLRSIREWLFRGRPYHLASVDAEDDRLPFVVDRYCRQQGQ